MCVGTTVKRHLKRMHNDIAYDYKLCNLVFVIKCILRISAYFLAVEI